MWCEENECRGQVSLRMRVARVCHQMLGKPDSVVEPRGAERKPVLACMHACLPGVGWGVMIGVTVLMVTELRSVLLSSFGRACMTRVHTSESAGPGSYDEN